MLNSLIVDSKMVVCKDEGNLLVGRERVNGMDALSLIIKGDR